MYFSQNNEEKYILEYFKDRTMTFLDCGSNDGITLSNTYALSLLGNSGVCIEPSPKAFEKLWQLYNSNPLIELFNVAISYECGLFTLFHSGSHLSKNDVSLLSSLDKKEIERWSKETFEEITVQTLTMDKILSQVPFEEIHFISIDVEGYDVITLKQLDLIKLKTEMVCIEWNGNQEVFNEVKEICNNAGLNKLLLKNQENIIWAKQQNA